MDYQRIPLITIKNHKGINYNGYRTFNNDNYFLLRNPPPKLIQVKQQRLFSAAVVANFLYCFLSISFINKLIICTVICKVENQESDKNNTS